MKDKIFIYEVGNQMKSRGAVFQKQNPWIQSEEVLGGGIRQWTTLGKAW